MTKRKPLVLLVEDDLGYASLVERLLPDFNVVHKMDLMPALSWLNDNEPSCILLDLTLPSSEGIETFVRISEQHKRLPVVLLTGASVSDDALNEAIMSGAQVYLQKDWIGPLGKKRTSPLLSTSITNAIVRKMLENTLADERNRWREIYSELWWHLLGLLSDGTDIGTEPQAHRKFIAKIEAAKEAGNEVDSEKILDFIEGMMNGNV